MQKVNILSCEIYKSISFITTFTNYKLKIYKIISNKIKSQNNEEKL